MSCLLLFLQNFTNVNFTYLMLSQLVIFHNEQGM